MALNIVYLLTILNNMCYVLSMHILYGTLYLSRMKRAFLMANETTNISIRMDKDLKEQAEALFSALGMNMTTAFNIFLRQSVRQGKIPFEISLNVPNTVTIAALEEADRISHDPNTKRYSSFSEIVAEVNSNV